ncbi:MAG TPA: ABC transporter ATP-binding protein [Candidatus Limnocylindrales bacterium]|nr:ABC transporter ATP-binding protein [Candidatus Limnocylindrales bacterium]
MSHDPVLELRDIAVGYGPAPVLSGVSLSAAAGETLALLGPSGSGKTSLLFAVAGFIEPMSGEILIRGRAVVGAGGRSLPPEQRRVGVVFQNYALWPHLDALETVAYPLRRRGLSRADAAVEALSLLSRLGIAQLAGRRPSQLSGGEQQRVGLARALARAPDVYLHDEPTAHLDTALKSALQEELRGGRGDAATLYATHDVGEAMAVADRVALLRDGGIAQVGTPAQVYAEPIDRRSAELTGPASVLVAELSEADGRSACVRIGDRAVRVSCSGSAAGRTGILVRPDWGRVGEGPLTGRVIGTSYRGTHTDYRIDTGAGELLVRDAGPPRLAPGAEVGWALERAWPMPLEEG